MTIKEKKDKLIHYCTNRTTCDNCKLNDKKHNWKNPMSLQDCLTIGTSDDEDLDKAIKLIGESEVLDKAHNCYKIGTFLDKKFTIATGIKDNVNSPSHYTDGKIEVIDYIEDKKLGFCLGNAIKYISRAGKKDKDKEAEDINKAIWYLKRYLKQLEEA